MLEGYWFNFNRGFITPAGTFKFNRRYVGMPGPKLYKPVIIAKGYSPYDREPKTPVIIAKGYSPYDREPKTPVIIAKGYSPYDYVKRTAYIFAKSYIINDSEFKEVIE